jgi:hypothetical protein
MANRSSVLLHAKKIHLPALTVECTNSLRWQVIRLPERNNCVLRRVGYLIVNAAGKRLGADAAMDQPFLIPGGFQRRVLSLNMSVRRDAKHKCHYPPSENGNSSRRAVCVSDRAPSEPFIDLVVAA